ncbi:MAG: hypothetical protein JWM33_179 [Caulobacteraceae bacterium]|nr:hypothetical protein [Caulobacteraceae bacterium]
MTINKLALSAAAALAVLTAAGAAQAEVTTSGMIGAFSDYRLRGQSLSNLTPVMQGDMEIATDLAPGLKAFAGVWGSSLDKEAGAGALEVDLYGGLSGSAAGFDWKTTYLKIKFPDQPTIDFDQYNASVGHALGPMSGTLGVVHDDYGKTDSTYYYGTVGLPIPKTPLALSATYGLEDGDTWDSKSSWGLGATATYQKFKLGLEYIDTNKDLLNASGKNLTGATVLLSLTAGF